MHQWKKLLSQGKLIKEVMIKGRRISITLHDEHNNPANYFSINNMFYNLWNVVPDFNQVFERVTLHNGLPFLNLENENHFATAQDALNALVQFGSQKHKRSNDVSASDEINKLNPDDIIIVKPQKIEPEKAQKKRREIHPWKKLLSEGKLIDSLEIKDSRVYFRLVEQYNNKSFFKGINIMLQKLYDKSDHCQQTYRRPTAHTSCPYLILSSHNTCHDSATFLNDLVNCAKQVIIKATKKNIPYLHDSTIINSSKTEASKPIQSEPKVKDHKDFKATIQDKNISANVEKPIKPLVTEAKVEDVCSIFKDLLEVPLVAHESLELPLTDIESAQPFLGFEYLLPLKLPTQHIEDTKQLPVANDERKVPIIRFKYIKK